MSKLKTWSLALGGFIAILDRRYRTSRRKSGTAASEA